MPVPYIGVTGFMTNEEVHEAYAAFSRGPDAKNHFMVGVLVSDKTLAGIPNKYPNRYPKVESISGIFGQDPDMLNLIHYSAGTDESLEQRLEALTRAGGENLDGFQINIPWPDPGQLARTRFLRPCTTVLQIGWRAQELMGNDPVRIALRVAREYHGLVDYVLIDASGGRGRPIDLMKTAELVDALSELDIGVGVAGGLYGDSVIDIAGLLMRYPTLSIDAEGKLRDEFDHLDIVKMREYLHRSLIIKQAAWAL